nr:protein FAR1-RELATED SEQUENCE 5-like [Hydra vulgaris]
MSPSFIIIFLQVAIDSQLPEEIKYWQLNWQCKHFGNFKTRGKEKRKIQHVLAKGCSFKISATYNRLLKKFVVTRADLLHSNHEVSSELYYLYHDYRKPVPERQAEIDNLLLMHANPTLVSNVLHQEGSHVRVKDLYNRKQKLLKSVGSINEAVQSALSQPGVISRIISGKDNFFEVLFFQTVHQQMLFSKFKEVIQMDATYKTNKMRYSLYTLLIEDNNGLGQPIGFGILAKEDQSHIEKFLKIFSEFNNITGVQCFIVDKDLAEINAIKTIFPNIHINICYFHILKAADKFLCGLNKVHNKKVCMDHFETLLNSKTSNDFDNEVDKIKHFSNNFHDYILQNWVPFKQNITSFSESNIMHLGNKTNNRIERFHSALKRVLGYAQLSLHGLIKSLLTIVEVRSFETHHRQFEMIMKTPIVTQPNVSEYYKLCTDYAARIISKEMELLQSKDYNVVKINNKWSVNNKNSQTFYTIEGLKCSCGMPTQMGVPCRHLFALWKFNNEPIYQPLSVSSRWKKEFLPSVVESSTSTVVSSASSIVTQAIFEMPKTTRIERFNNAMVVLKDLASLIADQPSAAFTANIAAIEKMKTLVMCQNVTALNVGLQTLIHELQPQTQPTLIVALPAQTSLDNVEKIQLPVEDLQQSPIISEENLIPQLASHNEVISSPLAEYDQPTSKAGEQACESSYNNANQLTSLSQEQHPAYT